MTEKSLPPKDEEPITLQSHEERCSPKFPNLKSEKEVYDLTQKDDSPPMNADGIDEFLQSCIASAQAEFARKTTRPDKSAADAALIGFLSAYVRRHSTPQFFLRALERSISDLKQSDKAEQSDA